MTAMPKFNFKSTLSEKEFKQEENKSVKSSPFFTPGKYDLKIIDAVVHVKDTQAVPGRSNSDSSWIVAKITLGGVNDKKIDHYLLVPTTSDRFGTKRSIFPMKNFREFVAALGLNPSMENIQNVLNSKFADLVNLIGMEVTVDIGHEGPHARLNLDTREFEIVDRDEKTVLVPETFRDRDSAAAFAAESQLELKNFVKVRKFHPRSEVEDNSKSGW